jgi:hypothetical protein
MVLPCLPCEWEEIEGKQRQKKKTTMMRMGGEEELQCVAEIPL